MKTTNPYDILLLAPHPFYEERGTPIAVDLLLHSLSELDYHVTVLTFHLGQHRTYPGVTILRTPAFRFITSMRPGFSFAKLFCDAFMLFKAIRLVRRSKPRMIHAVEESAFTALIIKTLFGIPYIYDMDSSMADQLVEKHGMLRIFHPVFHFFEKLVARHAAGVIPVCPALCEKIKAANNPQVHLLTDIAMLERNTDPLDSSVITALPDDKLIFLYVGNLESYQGIDLLIESFGAACSDRTDMALVIAGGQPGLIQHYKAKAEAMIPEQQYCFLGPVPTRQMRELFMQADVLVSPRVKGINTPMKIYSYLASGKPVLATRLQTHTQVLTDDVALLSEATSAAMSQAVLQLASDDTLRHRLGEAGQRLARTKYSPEAFHARVTDIYAALLPEDEA